MLKPRHVAFVGGKWAQRAARRCRLLGFEGDIWVVNPKPVEVEGARWFPSLAALPLAPDASYLGVRREVTVDMVDELAAMGAGGAVCFAAGFAEIGGDGPALQQALVRAAGEDFAIIGPNCWGFVNYADSVSLWADTWLRPRTGRGVAMISQSGNLSITLSSQDRSLPMSYVISVGNQALIGQAELIDALVDDPRVSAIALYIESIPDVATFAGAAMKAMARGVPLVAVKVGASEGAARVTMSHTSSLAGADELYDALFRRLGIVRAKTLSEMLEVLKVLSTGGGLSGRRLVSLSCSGGDAALMADHGAREGLQFPAFEPAVAAELRSQLRLFTSIGNPFDYNTGIWGDREATERVFSTALADDFDAAVLVIDVPPPPLLQEGQFDASYDGFAAACRNTGRRGMTLCMLGELFPAEAREAMFAAGIAPLQGLSDGLAAIAGAAWYGERCRALADCAPALPQGAVPLADGAVRTLDEAQGKRRLADFGVTVPEGRVVPAVDVLAAGRELGFPLVLKAVSAAIAHKSEAGAVVIGIDDEASLASALSGMQARLSQVDGAGDCFLVERMVDDAVAELIIGVKRDEQFGPAIVLGSGGVLVNLVADSVPLLLPLDRQQVREALHSLRGAHLLAGYRGRAPGDIEAAIDAVMAVAAFAQANAASLLELDVNPLMVRPEGHGAVAADALVRLVEPAPLPSATAQQPMSGAKR